mgnify:CR=1 FL=1
MCSSDLILKKGATPDQIKEIEEKIKDVGFDAHLIEGESKTVIGAVGLHGDRERIKSLIRNPIVDNIVAVNKPYKLASRTTKIEDSVVNVRNIPIGDRKKFIVIAGPCSVETPEQMMTAARGVKDSGVQFIRGGAYKPRTSPYSFQGLEEDGLKILDSARKETGLGIVTELISAGTAELVASYTDIIQIGARNMQNFSLLKDAGRTKKPILLKRGMSATLEELLMSAEYIMSEGNYNVMLCERGIRTFETAYRNTLDLNAVPALKTMSHLPVIVDPSHGTGRKDLITTMSKAAIAAGADGLIIEVHPKQIGRAHV